MKKFLSLILVAMLLLGTVACSSADNGGVAQLEEVAKNIYADETNGDQFTYKLNDKGGYDITGFLAKSSTPHKVVIPSEIADVEVSGIAAEAFKANSAISEVVIPDTVVSIGKQAFYGCMYLVSVQMSDSVTEIGTNVFDSCHALKSVQLSSSVKVIPEYAFRACTALESISLPAEIKKIDNGAFFACTALTDIAIPAGVESIGDCAFYGNTVLASATVPASVTTFGRYVFTGSAESFVLKGADGSAAQTYAEENGHVFEIA